MIGDHSKACGKLLLKSNISYNFSYRPLHPFVVLASSIFGFQFLSFFNAKLVCKKIVMVLFISSEQMTFKMYKRL